MNEWLKCALIRAVKTMAQTAVATIGTAAVMGAVDWKMVASASVLAGILSMLTSLAGLPEVDSGDAEVIHYDDEVYAYDVNEVTESEGREHE